jgi:hypothetical protein|tara:strand:- start:7439 stop:7663 length:225 start_codon:yes stop_codon:yes gene_type:complete
MATNEISGREYNRNPKNHKKKAVWPYKNIEDPEYIKEKMEFFKKNHNGWYVYRGVHSDHVPQKYKDRGPNKKKQ